MADDRRAIAVGITRGRTRVVWDWVFGGIRWLARHVHSAYTTFGLLILGGLTVAVFLTFGFAKLAEKVVTGKTFGFDDTIMRFFATHQVPWISSAMVELTSL